MKNLLIPLLFIFAGQSYATPQCNNIHTWHNVNAKEGQWRVTLQSINQQGYFADSQCSPLTSTIFSSAAPLVYGFGFSKDANFDIAYTLTAIKQEASFQSKACVFVITANGPAQPDITPLSYHGAVCEWKRIPGVGEDFIVG